jgi:hypothetical protein
MTKIRNPKQNGFGHLEIGRLKFVWDLGLVILDLRFIIDAHHQRNIKRTKISDTEESVSSPHV